MNAWHNTEDIRRDLFIYSNLDYMGDTFAPAPPKSILEYKARTSKVKNPGLFDDSDDTDVGVFISGRGKYIVDRIITPGRPVESVAEDDYSIQKKIREVCGLGYNNEIIETAFCNNSDVDDDNKSQDLMALNIKLKSGSGCPSPARSPQPLSVFQKSDSSVEMENQSTEDSNQSESVRPGSIKKFKKKKKFKCWYQNSGNCVQSVLNVNAPVWVPKHSANSINSEEFPSLK